MKNPKLNETIISNAIEWYNNHGIIAYREGWEVYIRVDKYEIEVSEDEVLYRAILQSSNIKS